MKLLGKYILGDRDVRVYTEKSKNGSFTNAGQTIIVGIEDEDWWQVVGILLHEATEAVYHNMKCRYDVDFYSHDTYLFIMNHPQFSEATAQIANFLVQCLPDLAKVYKQSKK